MEKGKVVTLDNLSTFKAEMDKSVDAKIEASGGTVLEYATDSDILGLFEEQAGEEETNVDAPAE